MKTLALLLPLLLAWPCAAETFVVTGQHADLAVSGSAELELDGSPRLELTLGGTRYVLRGYPLLRGGYLFVEASGGVTGGLAPAPTSIQRGVVLAERLNVRPGPSTDAPPLRRVERGTQLPIGVERDGPWIQLRGIEGWVHGGYVRVETVYEADAIPGDGLRLTLRENGNGYYGTVQGDMGVLRLVRVVAAGPPRALLIPARVNNAIEQRALLTFARDLARYYGPRGLEAEILQPESADQVVRYLEDAGLAGKRYSRVVWIGHGGWDGPIMGTADPRQLSGKYNTAGYAKLVAALRRALTSDAKLFASSCHAAGNNTHEMQMPSKSLYNWVHDLAKRTGRLVAGPAGLTSTEYTYQHVLAVLEGQGTVKQEVHVAEADTLRVVWPGRALSSAPTQPLPAIRHDSTPAGQVDAALGSLP